jgi:hypothetical protein
MKKCLRMSSEIRANTLLCLREIMRAKAIEIILSIALGLLAIYMVHCFLAVDTCLDMGGSIDSETGVCRDENYHEQYLVLSPALLTIYFFIGLVVSLLSVFIIKTIRRPKSG